MSLRVLSQARQGLAGHPDALIRLNVRVAILRGHTTQYLGYYYHISSPLQGKDSLVLIVST